MFYRWILLRPRFCLSLLADNAFLGIAAIGTTLVIFSGGIDLSVGAVIGFTSIFTATLIQGHGWPPALAWTVALVCRRNLERIHGNVLIHVFRLPAFLITLAGMFLARGAKFWINTESTGIDHPLYARISGYELVLGALHLPRGGARFLLAYCSPVTSLAHRHPLRPQPARDRRQRANRRCWRACPWARPRLRSIRSMASAPRRPASWRRSISLGKSQHGARTGTGRHRHRCDRRHAVLSGGRGHILGTLLGRFDLRHDPGGDPVRRAAQFLVDAHRGRRAPAQFHFAAAVPDQPGEDAADLAESRRM